MKRLLAILITISLLLGCASAETAAEPSMTHQIERKTFPFYFSSADQKREEDFPLFFVDGADDLPYVELNDWAKLMPEMVNNIYTGSDYQLTAEVKEEDKKVILWREKLDNFMEVDYNRGTISFLDYVAFVQRPGSDYMNSISIPATGPDGQPFLLQMKDSRSLYGDFTVLNLKEYKIPMVAQDGNYLLPLQTLSAFLLSPDLKCSLYFNGEAILFSSVKSMEDPSSQLYQKLVGAGLVTPEMTAKVKESGGTQAQMMEVLFEEVRKASDAGAALISAFYESIKNHPYKFYTSVAKTAARSQALTEYGYHELCLELDSFYGLKEAHNITNFDTFFMQNDMYANLTDPDPSKADKAISDLVSYWLDDGHSAFLSASAMTETPPDTRYGYGTYARSGYQTTYSTARGQHPEAALPYYEVGDTAYVCFDSYAITTDEYYTLSEMPPDTFGIIIDAHKQITRENSPIKNVVLDMSVNGGGMIDAAIFTLGWFLGDANFSYRNTFTGAQTTSTVRADVNLDHQFDENDTLAGRGLNLYCLISPVSFSCGNLVPWAFMENGSVTLLGRTSGGGSCMVGYISTAWGTSYRYSSSSRLSFVKNGAYYDVDQGVHPDFVIRDPANFYDREALTEFIHNLY